MMFASAMTAISTPASLIRLRARLRFTESAIQGILLVEKPQQERPVDGDDENEPDEQRRESEPSRERHLLLGWRTGEHVRELALAHHTVILIGPFLAEPVQPHLPREHDLVHREALRAEVRVEEVEGEDEADREQGFLAMHEHGDV